MEEKNIIPSENNGSNQPEVQQELEQAAEAVAAKAEEISVNPEPAEATVDVEETAIEGDTAVMPKEPEVAEAEQPAEVAPVVEAAVYAYRWDYAEQNKHDKLKKKKKDLLYYYMIQIVEDIMYILKKLNLLDMIQ